MDFNKELFQKILNDPTMVSRETVADKYGIGERSASYYWWLVQHFEGISDMFENDDELIEQNVRYQKQKQKFMDFNRIERKSFREYARVENAVSEYSQALMETFDANPYKPEGVSHISTGNVIGVMQWSDFHFNELINISTNQYDFKVASKRMFKYVIEAMRYFDEKGVTDVFVLGTSDWMNSDRRLDELVAMATNRSKATFIGVQILENALVHLNQKYNVHVAAVVGNESRVGKDYNWNNELVSDNYDFTIFNVLRYKLRHTNGINFLGISDKHETVVEVNNKNFLVIHGHQIGKDVSKDLSKLVRKYAQQGIIIHYTIWGHLHEAMLSDNYSRSASLCGSNSYSEDALLLVGRASQNIYLAYDCDRIDSIRIDLQDTDGYEGYSTQDWQDAYNPKSLYKSHKQETIFRITI